MTRLVTVPRSPANPNYGSGTGRKVGKLADAATCSAAVVGGNLRRTLFTESLAAAGKHLTKRRRPTEQRSSDGWHHRRQHGQNRQSDVTGDRSPETAFEGQLIACGAADAAQDLIPIEPQDWVLRRAKVHHVMDAFRSRRDAPRLPAVYFLRLVTAVNLRKDPSDGKSLTDRLVRSLGCRPDVALKLEVDERPEGGGGEEQQRGER